MQKFTPPQVVQVKNDLDKQPLAPVVEKTEVKEPASPVTAMVKPKNTNKSEVLKQQLDSYVEVLRGANRRQYTSDELSDIQCSFMDTIDSSLRLGYEDYVSFMEHFIGLIHEYPEAFTSAKRLKFIEYIRSDNRKNRADYKQRFRNYIEAVMVLSQNMAYRQRVGALVDIRTLANGLHPTAANNINTYFTAAYN